MTLLLLFTLAERIKLLATLLPKNSLLVSMCFNFFKLLKAFDYCVIYFTKFNKFLN